MADELFDLCYTGAIATDADPAQVRERLCAVFKLAGPGCERLFSGKRVVVKRGVDAATVAQYRQVFSRAGAVLEVTPSERAAPAPQPVRPAPDGPVEDPAGSPETLARIDGEALALAPQDGFLEPSRTVKMPAIDTSHLTLVQGADWTLADCEPPPTPIPTPDIDHLSLVDIEPEEQRQERSD
ncbi:MULTISPECIES: hypothetical protein [Marichromatium]|uniref:Uncharacterized protein n=1 Tax=Marichromatium gracile TaxID=1048 RepID=A0A4V2WAA0_MARGR|nr:MULTISPECIES: hypothetical protein [Marichromatium]MBO8085823.1 hypothetical protein [Marichromatium sp.]MBK1708351.1 hypothetical protein [Marichromatium gracile]RNE91160.1 hypothetical protein EBL84_03840 [Marichromatium sp. AB31]RNE93012.1 hypothetical protein EBL85_09180 [Marichromatium sp. AB32]TCW38520.1 hypothetical protein EDC29_102416 [Marichromatium gracile]